jgi:hypothetical protein
LDDKDAGLADSVWLTALRFVPAIAASLEGGVRGESDLTR